MIICRKDESNKQIEALQEDVTRAGSRTESMLEAARTETSDVRVQHASLMRAYESLQAVHSSTKEQADQVCLTYVLSLHSCCTQLWTRQNGADLMQKACCYMFAACCSILDLSRTVQVAAQLEEARRAANNVAKHVQERNSDSEGIDAELLVAQLQDAEVCWTQFHASVSTSI